MAQAYLKPFLPLISQGVGVCTGCDRGWRSGRGMGVGVGHDIARHGMAQ